HESIDKFSQNCYFSSI
ncbi:unnamed protein product, partial [Acanthoscelides obtectus]